LKFLSGAIFWLDLWTKVWAIENLASGSRTLWTGIFGGVDVALTLATNTGTAWGLFASYPGLLTIARVVIGIFLIGYYFLARQLTAASGLGIILILGGACGNLWDVRLRGAVVDFVDITLWGWHYPIFNVADCAIVLGALMFLFSKKK
jgi:signal peptidase II